VAGAVLAFAVTIHNKTIDVQTAGVILLLVGAFDLLLNFGLSIYARRPAALHDPYPRSGPPLAAAPRPADAPRAASPGLPDRSDSGLHTTQRIEPIRDNPDWR